MVFLLVDVSKSSQIEFATFRVTFKRLHRVGCLLHFTRFYSAANFLNFSVFVDQAEPKGQRGDDAEKADTSCGSPSSVCKY